MSAHAAVQKTKANTQDDAHNVRNPVIYVGAAVDAGLYQLDGAAEGRGADEDGQQSKAPRAGQREGKRREGNEVHELVAALWRFHWPEHGDGQRDGHGERQEYVEIFAHANRLKALEAEHKEKPRIGCFAVKVKGTLNQQLGGSDKLLI